MDQSLAHYFYKKALYSRHFAGVDLSLTMLCKCTGNPCVRDTPPRGPGLQKHVKEKKKGQEIWVSCRRQNLNFRFCFKPLLGYSLLMCFCLVMLCFKCLPWGRPPIWETHKAVSVFHPGIPFTSVIAAACNITHTAFTHELLSSPSALIIWAKGQWGHNEAMIFQDAWEIALHSVFISAFLVGEGYLRAEASPS